MTGGARPPRGGEPTPPPILPPAPGPWRRGWQRWRRRLSPGQLRRLLPTLDAMMSGADPGVAGRVFRALTRCIEPIYRFVTDRRNVRFDRGRGVHEIDLPVVSVGNLTTGGTGKTPMVIHLAGQLRAAGHRPAILMRGYKSKQTGGSDEQALYHAALPDVPVIAQPDRVAAARQLQDAHPAVDVILLDDGFQHRRLARTVDIVLIDARCPFGYDHLLPRGLLRERPENLRRADAVIVTRSDALDADGLAALIARIEGLHGKRPLAFAEHQWTSLVDATGEPIDAVDVSVLAVCGIGQPTDFLAQAARRFHIAARAVYPDHHDYPGRTLAELRKRVREHQPEAILTTEKDWVKLRRRLAETNEAPGHLAGVPIWRPQLALRVVRGDAALWACMEERCFSAPRRS